MNRFDRMYYLLDKRNMSAEKLLKDLVEKISEEDAVLLFESIELMNGFEPSGSDEFDEKWYDDKWDEESTKI